jgi:hypothetical protein
MKPSNSERVEKILNEAWQKIRKIQRADSRFDGVLSKIESAILTVKPLPYDGEETDEENE